MSSSEIIFFKSFPLIFYHLSLNDDFVELLSFFFFNFQCFLLKIVYHFRKHEFIKKYLNKFDITQNESTDVSQRNVTELGRVKNDS